MRAARCARPLLALALGPLCMPPVQQSHRLPITRMSASTPPRDDQYNTAQADSLDLPPSSGAEQLHRAGERDGTTAYLRSGHVYFVSTPIGNLDDITLRAVRTLKEADFVASEDTRHTAKLLRHLGASTKKQISHHEHNARAASARIIELASKGATIAVVSDAGTPGISDPGAILAASCADAGIPLVPVPGACAAVAAMSISGYPCTGFRFCGFLPRSGRARKDRVAEVVRDPKPAVLYEAPHRLVATLSDLAAAGASERKLIAARELTKLHEAVTRGSVASLASHFATLESDGKLRGEFTLVLAPLGQEELEARAEVAHDETMARARELLEERLAAGEPLSYLVKEVAAELGARKRPIYDLALEIQAELRVS
mmetsp:Transcript_22222/g.62048  ORF Transcript_22222/g.62048 Transcript_22222/m.62048 type:complete len:373 (+) Transcript_22222:44-1162(+)